MFELTAEHGCFRMNTSARSETGQISSVFSDFIESIKCVLKAPKYNFYVSLIEPFFDLRSTRMCFDVCSIFRSNLESDTDCVNTTLQELRLHLAAFIANVINSIPRGVERMRLFSTELRYSLFYLFSSWCELFGISSSNNGEQDSRYLHVWGVGMGTSSLGSGYGYQ